MCNFNPPAPCGAGRRRSTSQCAGKAFQSTRPARGGTTIPPLSQVPFTISIHPPRAGRDLLTQGFILGAAISIHPPRAGRDKTTLAQVAIDQNFNPPAPCGAGRRSCTTGSAETDFNPPAPCGAGLSTRCIICSAASISIHPPRAGRDDRQITANNIRRTFQSTRPVRGGTPNG